MLRFKIGTAMANGLAVLLLGWCVIAEANQTLYWTPCACDNETYTLTVSTGIYGTAAKSPNKPSYAKGESVTVGFSPNADYVFDHWLCTPASHTASGSTSSTVVVFITGDTVLTPVVIQKDWTLCVFWNNALGSVALPPGGQGGNGFLTAPLVYGETLTLTANHLSNYFTLWHGIGGTNWSGYRYGDSLSIKAWQKDIWLIAEFCPEESYPETMNQLTVNWVGATPEVFCSGAPDGSWNAGPYPYNTAEGPSWFSFSVVPPSGYAHEYVTWSVAGVSHFGVGGALTHTPGNTYTSHIIKKIKLDIQTEGQGAVTSPNFVCSWNPHPHEWVAPGTDLIDLLYGNAVTMTPDPCPGWAFLEWQYKDSVGAWVLAPGDPQYLTVYMNWWEGDGLRVPNGTTLFAVKAIFEKLRMMAVHSSVSPETDPLDDHGHGWISVWTGSERHTYGLYHDNPANPASDVCVDVDLNKLANQTRYYTLKHPGDLDTFIAETGDVYDLFFYNCASWAAEAVAIGEGEELAVGDPWYLWRPTPRKLSESIAEKEASQPTSEACPKP